MVPGSARLAVVGWSLRFEPAASRRGIIDVVPDPTASKPAV
jgi:hypothetical protein